VDPFNGYVNPFIMQSKPKKQETSGRKAYELE